MAYAQTIMQGGFSGGSALAIAGGVATAVSAAGTTQATATDLAALGFSIVSTVASGTGVQLYPGSAGDSTVVLNTGANVLTVYPPTSAKFNSLSTNAGVTLGVNSAAMFLCASATQWTVILSA